MQLLIVKHNYLHISPFKTLFFSLGQFVARSSFGAFLRLSVSYFGIPRSSLAVRLFSWFALSSLYAPCIHSRKISRIIVCSLFSVSSWVRLTSSRILHGAAKLALFSITERHNKQYKILHFVSLHLLKPYTHYGTKILKSIYTLYFCIFRYEKRSPAARPIKPCYWSFFT